jgi:hypothetical protein
VQRATSYVVYKYGPVQCVRCAEYSGIVFWGCTRSPKDAPEAVIILIVARMWRLYKTGIGLTTGFIRSHTVTHNYSVTLYNSQLTIVLAGSSSSVFIGCLSSNTVGSVHLQLFSEDCCFTVVSRLGNSTPNSQLTALPPGWITD